MLPMSDLMAATISPEEVDFELDPDSMDTLNEFETAWKKFMKAHPELIPEGKREKHIKKLQKEVKAMDKTKTDASVELHKQLDFFEKNRKAMEKTTKKEIEDARAKQKKNCLKIEKQLDSIALAEHVFLQAYPWEHFLASVDKASTLAIANDGKHDKKAKPSKRALYLVDDTVGDEQDVELRAYQIDHALLHTQIKMLQKEAEGYEKILETQETLKAFLHEHNVGGGSLASRSTRISTA